MRLFASTMRPASSVTEIRLHGRGGQGGVTCAKIIASVFAHLGKSVQAFGDYAGERSGAPIRAYTRISDQPIENRNKVYQPHHLVVLDPALLGDDVLSGLAPGGALVVNTSEPAEALAKRYPAFRVAAIDATRIARAHKIGSRSVVIVNTTLAGALAKVFGLPFEALQQTYADLGLLSNLDAAREAYQTLQVCEPSQPLEPKPAALAPLPEVLPLEEHRVGLPTGLKTGSWRTQTPRYATQLAPCNAFCPAGNDVVGFVQALATKTEAEAARVLGETTPLASVCGRVCPAPCMDGCNRRELDGAVDVRGLERWIADHAPVARALPRPAEHPRRVAVVGSGPAGLSAAYQLARAGHHVTLLEAEAKLGGLLRTGIPSYRLPREALDRDLDAVLELGVEVVCGARIDAPKLESLSHRYDAVVLATGLQKLRAAGVPGRVPKGVEQGIDYLRRLNLEGKAPLAGHVVVLGGGNTAMDCARSALRSGASRVTVVYRRTREEMPAIAEEVEQAHEEGVEYLFLRAPEGFVGDDRVTAVKLAKVELGPPDASGRRSPVVTGEVEQLACDAVLLALGQSADLSILPAGWELAEGRAHVGRRALNVFAAGDVTTGDGTVTHAIGSGRRAATAVLAHFGLKVEHFVRPDRSTAVPSTDIRFDHFDRAAPTAHRLAPARLRKEDLREVDQGLPDALESHRCFSCGHCTRCDTCLVYCPEGIIRRKDGDYAVDYAFCKGCGICVTECPRRAMEMSAS